MTKEEFISYFKTNYSVKTGVGKTGKPYTMYKVFSKDLADYPFLKELGCSAFKNDFGVSISTFDPSNFGISPQQTANTSSGAGNESVARSISIEKQTLFKALVEVAKDKGLVDAEKIVAGSWKLASDILVGKTSEENN